MRTIVLALLICCIAGCTTEPLQTGSIKLEFGRKAADVSRDSLYPVFPNPFNRVGGDTGIFIQFAIADTSAGNVVIQNALGDPVANYYDTLLTPGIYGGWWEPRAKDGTLLVSGIYFVTLQNGAFIYSRLIDLQENE